MEKTDKLKTWFESRAKYHDELYYEGVYGKFVYFVNMLRLKLLAQSVRDQTILDIGCGTGGYLIPLAKLEAKFIVGIDLSTQAISRTLTRAKRHNLTNEISLVMGDALHLPFKDNTFDTILMISLLNHIPGPLSRQKAVREALNILRPRGVFTIEVPRLSSKEKIIHHFKEFSEPNQWVETNNLIIYNHSFTETETKELIEKSGGVVINISGAEAYGYRGIMPLTRRLSRLNYIPKWLAAIITIIQFCLVNFKMMKNYWRGIKITVTKHSSIV